MSKDRPPFIVYLVQSGALQPDDLVKILDIQYRQRQPFGRIALRTRKLTVKQTSEILSYQATHPDERFGEIAVKLSYMTEAEVTEILALQRKSMLTIEEIIVSEGFLTRAQLDRWKRAYDVPVADAA